MVVVGGPDRLSQKMPDESDLTEAGPSLSGRNFFLASLYGTMEDCDTERSAALRSLAVLKVSVLGD